MGSGRRWLTGLWLLILVGLAVRVWGAPTIVGSYDAVIDDLLYLGQRWLRGGWLYMEHQLGVWPIVQPLYAVGGALGSIRVHRIVVLLANLLSGLLLARTIQGLSRQGTLPLRPGSLVPAASGVLLVVMSQKLPGGLSGHPHQFANTFLVLALFTLTRGRPLLAGMALLAAMACMPALIHPLALTAALLVALQRPPRRTLARLVGGMLLALLLLFVPYLAMPDGAGRAWAGAVALPLEWSSLRLPPNRDLLELVGDLLRTRLAGLPLWILSLVPLVGVGQIARCRWSSPGPKGDRLLLVPGLVLVCLADLAMTFQRSAFHDQDTVLLAVPLALLTAAGIAALERSTQRWSRWLARCTAAVLTLILVNNIVVSELTRIQRPTGTTATTAPITGLERDRTAVRDYLRRLPPGERGFTAPQDVGLQWQMGLPASTVGIGPEWSLNQQNLSPSPATRRLGLAIRETEACAQLTAATNRHLVWRRTDPEGRNTREFLLSCLNRQPGAWEEISQEIGLHSGEMAVFRRRSRAADGS